MSFRRSECDGGIYFTSSWSSLGGFLLFTAFRVGMTDFLPSRERSIAFGNHSTESSYGRIVIS